MRPEAAGPGAEARPCAGQHAGVPWPACLLLAGNLCWFTPAEIYRHSGVFFDFPLRQLALPLSGLFVVATVAFGLVAVVLRRFRRVITAVLSVLAFLSWLVPSFLYHSYGVLDGQHFRLPATSSTGVVEIAGLLVAAGGMGWLALRFPRQSRQFAGLLFALLFLSSLVVVVRDPNPQRRATPLDEVATFSTKRNVLVILLDTLQSDIFERLLQEDRVLARQLDGFTYYEDAISLAPTTYLSLPSIHSGQPYQPGASLPGYYESAIRRGSVFNTLAQAGYRVEIVNDVINICPQDVERCTTQNLVLHGFWPALLKEALLLVDMTLLRTAPIVAKAAIFRDGAWLFSSLLIAEDRGPGGNRLLDALAAHISVSSPRPTARLLHLYSTHPPAQVDAACAPVSGAPWNRESAAAQAACSVRHVLGLLAALTTAGVYDQTAVVVLADHGAGFAPWPLPEYLTASDTFTRLVGAARSLLLVKPPNARGELRVSAAPVHLPDLPVMLQRMSDGSVDPGLREFEALLAQSPRVRDFIFYNWRTEYWTQEFLPIEAVYHVSGPSSAAASWAMASLEGVVLEAAATWTATDPPGQFGFGWSQPEESGTDHWRWTVGPAAQFTVPARPGHALELHLDVFTHGGNPEQELTIYVAGRRVETLSVPPGRYTPGVVIVPAEMVQGTAVSCTFAFRQWNPPAGDDPRPLAVAFRRLEARSR